MIHYILIDHLLFTRWFRTEDNRLIRSFSTSTLSPVVCVHYTYYECSTNVECELNKFKNFNVNAVYGRLFLLNLYSTDHLLFIHAEHKLCAELNKNNNINSKMTTKTPKSNTNNNHDVYAKSQHNTSKQTKISPIQSHINSNESNYTSLQ